MLSLSNLLFAALISHASIVSATPVVATPAATEAASATCPSSGVATFNAKFDKLSPNTAIPDGFGNAQWHGMTTIDPIAANYAVNPSSGKLVAQSASGALGAQLTLGIGQLDGFDFACTTTNPNFSGTFAYDCDVLVVTNRDFPDYGVHNYGPYSFTANQTLSVQTMERVRLTAPATDVYIYIVSAGSEPQLLLDNVILETQCNT